MQQMVEHPCDRDAWSLFEEKKVFSVRDKDGVKQMDRVPDRFLSTDEPWRAEVRDDVTVEIVHPKFLLQPFP